MNGNLFFSHVCGEASTCLHPVAPWEALHLAGTVRVEYSDAAMLERLALVTWRKKRVVARF